MIVILNDGLDEFGTYAFEECTSLEHIIIPNNVKANKWRANSDCSGLMTVTLGDGLEEIGGILKLHLVGTHHRTPENEGTRILLVLAVDSCYSRRGLEEIGLRAFRSCISLQRIVIPSRVKSQGN